MKYRLIFILNFLLCFNLYAREHSHVFSPQEEKQYLSDFFGLLEFRFSQTDWRECTDYVTGNYLGYRCANRRMISVILKTFMNDHMKSCVQEGMNAFNLGTLQDLHIVHKGILGDRRHSPRSLHAENRAIDIDRFKITNTQNDNFEVVYRIKENRNFFIAFRKCWGKKVTDYNGCPLYKNQPLLTGSIGWEDRNHQNHMHTSVPYCLNGKYGAGYYRR